MRRKYFCVLQTLKSNAKKVFLRVRRKTEPTGPGKNIEGPKYFIKLHSVCAHKQPHKLKVYATGNISFMAIDASFSMFGRAAVYNRGDRGGGLGNLARIQTDSVRVGTLPNAADVVCRQMHTSVLLVGNRL